MESWRDQGIVLSNRAHGESGAIVTLLTQQYGLHAGYVYGGMSSKKRAALEPGSMVQAEWQARTAEQLGTFTLESEQTIPPGIYGDALKNAALQAACALCQQALPEREAHPGLYYGLEGLIQLMETDEGLNWLAAYIMWEIQFLRELGFRLELDKCAAGGDPAYLTHVSPKSGRAVSAAQAEPYKEKLLELPEFLKPSAVREEDMAGSAEDFQTGLVMTLYFLEHWPFAQHSQGLPPARLLLQERMERLIAKSQPSEENI
jgi:DNA repair protein RecO (recombination protein O)